MLRITTTPLFLPLPVEEACNRRPVNLGGKNKDTQRVCRHSREVMLSEVYLGSSNPSE